LLWLTLQYNPQEISLAINKSKRDENGRVVQAGREGAISTQPTASVPEPEAAPAQPEEEAVPSTSAASEVTISES
jgi:hypothetical protein